MTSSPCLSLRVLPAVLLLLNAGALFAPSSLSQASSSVAQTPPMGWNSWNKFACNVSDKLIREMADAMVSSGMQAAGYQYVNIDDCWQVSRDPQGAIVADPQRFPSGMKVLADYVHSKGLKLGLYTDAGTGTCEKRPGSLNHEVQDAKTYASWGIDYVKIDWCNSEGLDPEVQYAKFRDALAESGRPMVAGPGHWNDPDMLEVGNGHMNREEYRTHMALWALLAAPLLAGNDLRNMPAETKELLTNSEVIAVDQDSKGIQGHRLWQEGPLEIWARPLADGSKAVGLFNRSESAIQMTLEFKVIDAPEAAKLRDLLDHKDLGTAQGSYTTKVPKHGVVLLKVSK